MILELHAIQSFAPANLNRDDLGAPKECTFGGVRRARVSSQAWKRAIRMRFREEAAGIESGIRTKRVHAKIVQRIHTLTPDLPADVVEHRAAVVLQADPLGLTLERPKGEVKTGQLIFFRDRDLDELAAVAKEFGEELDSLPSIFRPKDQKRGKKPEKAVLPKPAVARVREAMTSPGQALDVALFGRMVAEMPEGNVDAACQVAHAIGTHRLAPEYDYYTAVDDLRPEDTEGADMIGTVQFNASCLYRYAALDTSQLAANLGEDVDLGPAVAAFARAFALAIPTGKQNTFAARNPPSAVLGVRRAAGAWNLANAFIRPIHGASVQDGVATASTRAMLNEFTSLQRMYGRADENLWAALLSAETVEVPAGVAPVEHLNALVDHVAGL